MQILHHFSPSRGFRHPKTNRADTTPGIICPPTRHRCGDWEDTESAQNLVQRVITSFWLPHLRIQGWQMFFFSRHMVVTCISFSHQHEWVRTCGSNPVHKENHWYFIPTCQRYPAMLCLIEGWFTILQDLKYEIHITTDDYYYCYYYYANDSECPHPPTFMIKFSPVSRPVLRDMPR